ncbi:ATP-binding protein [Undibacterium sp. TC9W]|uniref:ATP-binding protein n=1 Tax=Undibacterium sp. TC9W TaxID=3413053 RepID=UPI003BF405D7
MTTRTDTPIRIRIWQLAILACSALGMFALVLTWMQARTREANLRIEHTQLVRRELANYAKELIDAETSQRGYLLTRQEVYLAPYQQVIADNKLHFVRLTELVKNPVAVKLLPRLGQVFDAKLEEIGETIQLAKAGQAEQALAIIREGIGRRYTEEFQQIGQQISKAEVEQLESQQAMAEVANSRVLWATGMGGAFAVFLILFAARKTVTKIDVPLRDLIKGLDALAQGDLTQRVHLQSQDEIGKVATAFNEMADRLVTANLAREQIEAKLREHHEHLEEMVAVATGEVNAIVSTAVSGIITIDIEGIIHVFNPAAEKLFGWQNREVTGNNVAMLMTEPDASQHNHHLTHFADTGLNKVIGIKRDLVARRKDGSTFAAQLAVGHAELSAGKHFFVGFITDISDQKALQDKLQRAKDAAEAGARAKATFIANMSHEIRTPMNAIIGFSEVLLQDTALSPQSAEHVRIVLESAKALLAIINDVLDVAKLESGKFALESVVFHLPNALADMLKLLDHQASEKGLKIVLEYDVDLPLRFAGDPTRLRQVVLNLVSNAIKFTEKGSILISVKPTELENVLHFAIADTGIGMLPEQVASVFDSFTQADSSTTRRFGGTGLGTTISKQIVELMGGKIWVDSCKGEGSTFHFTTLLQVATTSAGSLFEEGSTIVDGYISPRLFNVLLVEDIETNATLVTLRLQQQGHQVEWCRNGQEALSRYQEAPFDLILMDVMMPVMDGLQATKKIRQLEEPRGEHTPVIALTASIMREDNEKCLAAGMDGILAKPIDFNDLMSAMERAVPAGKGIPNAVLRIEIAAPTTDVDFSALDGIADHPAAIRTWRDPLAYARALSSFATERRSDADEMERLLNTNSDNCDKAREVAHALKGLAGNLFITQVAAQIIEIDAYLKAGKRINAIAGLTQLRVLLAQASDAIGKIELVEISEKPAMKNFDVNTVMELFTSLEKALATLNPDFIEPVLLQLRDYFPKSDLAPIEKAVEAFDFETAAEKSAALSKMLGLAGE